MQATISITERKPNKQQVLDIVENSPAQTNYMNSSSLTNFTHNFTMFWNTFRWFTANFNAITLTMKDKYSVLAFILLFKVIK